MVGLTLLPRVKWVPTLLLNRYKRMARSPFKVMLLKLPSVKNHLRVLSKIKALSVEPHPLQTDSVALKWSPGMEGTQVIPRLKPIVIAHGCH